MAKQIFFLSFFTFLFFGAFCQTDSVKSRWLTITGSVDGYYRFGFANAKDEQGKEITDNYTSFTNSQNSFELGMASVQVAHSFGKASAFIDLGFGRRAEEFSYANSDYSSMFAVKQAYLSYTVSDKFKLSLGKWVTHVGYELVDAYQNRNYSMSYLFSFGPFSHTGIKADIGLGKKSALMVGVSNPTDNATTLSSRKYGLAQFSTSTSDEKLKAYLNYVGSYGGSFNSTQLDMVVVKTFSDKFNIAYNGTVKFLKPESVDDAVSWGSALYFNIDPTEKFGVTLRGEYFDDEQNAFGFGTDVLAFTISPNIRINNLTIIPELRLDNCKTAIFKNHSYNNACSSLAGLLAVTYYF
ncbi:MAG: porin [Bacteroidetes bacterium]|nr:porin [Bacteroidota bacterium]